VHGAPNGSYARAASALCLLDAAAQIVLALGICDCCIALFFRFLEDSLVVLVRDDQYR
jgi:hypothetical protein